jgi:hypothetical protein
MSRMNFPKGDRMDTPASTDGATGHPGLVLCPSGFNGWLSSREGVNEEHDGSVQLCLISNREDGPLYCQIPMVRSRLELG